MFEPRFAWADDAVKYGFVDDRSELRAARDQHGILSRHACGHERVGVASAIGGDEIVGIGLGLEQAGHVLRIPRVAGHGPRFELDVLLEPALHARPLDQRPQAQQSAVRQ